MFLKALLDKIPCSWTGPDQDPEISGFSCDSRMIRPGDVFVAVKGQRHDGHDHAAEVVRAGAAAVVAERPLELPVPVAVVRSTLEVLSPLSARFYGHPSHGMAVVGITGTNGKTTITYLLENILKAAGHAPGVIGTVEYRWADKKEKAPNTTPFSADLQRLLARMKQDGATHVAMEVSSHALALHRVDDVAFAAAVFTNLTRDHLDFHQDMDSYFLAKARLFELLDRTSAPPQTGGGMKFGIINVDDAWSEKMRSHVKGAVLTYGLKTPSDLSAADISLAAEGTAFTLVSPQGTFPCRLHLVGAHNISNALAAAGAAIALGIPMDAVLRGLETLPGVPGRLERVTLPPEERADPLPFSVFVDYAHTDDALKNVLSALRPLTKGRLITVFGCGGDRDRTKRPVMGEVAMKMSDHVVVTSDNPRSEDPQRITLDIEVGIRRAGGTHYEIVLDRESAIDAALRRAQAGDVVLVAGKGHETYQIFKDRTIDFDDRVTVRHRLKSVL
ncbi:MAG: UDP-N-acetylmuramoyl-L-alanyl-D-glutamate--2,6-diaminopimelate ligase [Elusimicrobia bacterium]|nr:UDP-N-acetylmuramoyl-L-alanyl-D-glutamate--2,6-diaminopimelate ligase [Elusimicrobiota bacterium]